MKLIKLVLQKCLPLFSAAIIYPLTGVATYMTPEKKADLCEIYWAIFFFSLKATLKIMDLI